MKQLFILLVCCVLFVSCNKNDTTAPTVVDPNTITVVSAAPFYGVMINAKLVQIQNGVITAFVGHSEANFSNVTFTSENNLPVVYGAGQVSLNGKIFKRQSVFAPSYTYYDSTYTKFSTPSLWKVTGGDYTPYIYFKNNDGFPVFSNYNLIPDTVHRNRGALNLTFPNLTNVNEISTTVDGFLRTIDYNQTNTVTYDSAMVSNIINNNSTITVKFKMCKYIMVGGKTYKLINMLEILKYNVKFVSN